MEKKAKKKVEFSQHFLDDKMKLSIVQTADLRASQMPPRLPPADVKDFDIEDDTNKLIASNLIKEYHLKQPKQLDLIAWLEQNKKNFKKPDNMVSMLDNQLKVNICSGPMDRRDYHMCECEKVYIQLKGDMTLRLVQIGDFKS